MEESDANTITISSEAASGLSTMLEWTYSGVDHTLAGNGGVECRDFIPYSQKVVESMMYTGLGLAEIYFTYPYCKLPKTLPPTRTDRVGRRILLLIMCLTFGIEMGFKFATKQVIWILNPCHLVTMIQIFLLVAPPSKFAMALFRIQMHCLSGASIAVIFPVINTRLLQFETEIYYIQHVMMLVVPYYLMRTGGIYTCEPLSNYYWVFMTLGLLFTYHWGILQYLAMYSLVNLNNMMCPAVSDPFYGRWYRVAATLHQTATICFHGKLYTWIASKFLPHRKIIEDFQCPGQEGEELESNGHAKIH